MSTILTAIVFVKSANGSRTLSGTATARLDDDEYVDIQYKAFNVDEANLIDEIQENTIMLFAGKYIFDKSQLFVIVNKSTLLDLKTIEDKPTIYDLPISPLYGVITAPWIHIPCFYDPDNGHHGGVANATKNEKQIFTVAGEVFLAESLCKSLQAKSNGLIQVLKRPTTMMKRNPHAKH
ncbi:1892_t:CDS:2 [Entrophospora sp. SA101]|nr:1892_t:CDS:2 [Entrophospora sp. SA101]